MIKRPNSAEIRQLGAEFGLQLSGKELDSWVSVIHEMLGAYDQLEEMEDARQPLRARDPGARPSARENPLGAWAWRVDLPPEADGPLRGLRVAVKDNIAVRGVPLTHGSEVLVGYVPDNDATAVERTLRAGASVVGMATCEAFCVSGGSHTSASGVVLNPHDPSRTSGGSSGGAAALVAAGSVDLAIGSDQGGSIRGPASWCGVVGFKPTYGLIPYTGAIPGEMTMDHLGPIGRDVLSVATYLSVLAGPDGLDPRQTCDAPADYLSSLDNELAGRRIGLLDEGFSHTGLSEEVVDDTVREQANALRRLGATVERVSLPFHRHVAPIRAGILYEGTASLLSEGLIGTNWRGMYSVGLASRLASGLASGIALPETVATLAVAGRWAKRVGHGEFYARAQNLARALTQQYEEAFTRHDLLIMPTLPMRAPLLPEQGLGLRERLAASRQTGANTSPFNITGHPAISVPCGIVDGLPVGLMIVGSLGSDALVLNAAHVFEREIFKMPSPSLVRLNNL